MWQTQSTGGIMRQCEDQQWAEPELNGEAGVRPPAPPSGHLGLMNVVAVILFVAAVVVIAIALYQLLG